MYKWHAHSAIGRGRPVAQDISRVADRIAASLRHFTVTRDGGSGGDNREGPSRSQRSREAFNEVSSLAPKPSNVTRGIDARALAAKPPTGSFTIVRERFSGPTPGRSPGGYRGGFRGPGEASTGGFRGGARPGGYEGGYQGRATGGPQAGRGRPGMTRGRGSRRGGGKRTRAPRASEEDYAEEPYTDAEKAYLYNSQCGFREPYNPSTSAESMAAVSPPVVSSSKGVNHTIAYKLQTATGTRAGHYYHAANHIARVHDGNGFAFFEDGDQKSIANSWLGQRTKDISTTLGKGFAKAQVGDLDEKAKETLMKTWVAGQYQAPKTPAANDVLGQVDFFLRRNETYLPQDTRKLVAKLSSLLP
ncbi:hypothetical protein HYALB_00008334 [Hymenoscyphus albidus]|uniref:Uncharacterized protein n=1 Tax=Hymenoscyphus albidus TaxID=595503 RepID=A0A9N9Q2Q1_9HELO|nr:hypothetical protein HYALB_00008334 [Hymenoscyphus albidus]